MEDDITIRWSSLKRSLVAHDFLLRALLTHLALSSPQSFEGIIHGFANSRLYEANGEAGVLTREITEQLVSMLEEIMGSLAR